MKSRLFLTKTRTGNPAVIRVRGGAGHVEATWDDQRDPAWGNQEFGWTGVPARDPDRRLDPGALEWVVDTGEPVLNLDDAELLVRDRRGIT
jgi:hypothetical protein